MLNYKDFLDNKSQSAPINGYLKNVLIKESRIIYDRLHDLMTYMDDVFNKVIQKQAAIKDVMTSISIFEQFEKMFKHINQCADSNENDCKRQIKAYHHLFKYRREKIKSLFDCAANELDLKLRIANSFAPDIITQRLRSNISEKIETVKEAFSRLIGEFKKNKHSWLWNIFVFTFIIMCITMVIPYLVLILLNAGIANMYWMKTEPKKRSLLKFFTMMINPFTLFNAI